MRLSRRWLQIALAVMVAAGVAGYAGAASHASVKANAPYKVGFMSDFAGPYSGLGSSLRSGFDAYITFVNKHGGVNGHQIAVHYLDDQSNPTTAATNFVQFATGDKDIAVAGSLGFVTGTLAPLAQQYGLPLIADNASVSTVIPPQPFTFIIALQFAEQASPALAFAKTLFKSGAQRVGIVNVTPAPSASFGAGVATVADSMGWQVVDHETLDPTNPSPTVEISRLLAARPTVVFMNGPDPIIASFKQAESAAGVDLPLITLSGAPSYALLQTLKDPNIYVLSPYVFVNTHTRVGYTPGVRTYRELVHNVGGDPNGPYTVHGYLEARLLVNALSKCGASCNRARLQRALETARVATQGVTVAKTIGYTPARHEPFDVVSVWHWNTHASAMQIVKAGLPGGTP